MNEDRPNIEVVKELIRQKAAGHRLHVKRIQEADRYYRNRNDIIRTGVRGRDDEPLRNADNRIPRNFHGLLVNQKAAYMFTAPPLFDTKNEELNKRIADILGDQYPKICKDLCISASNSGTAWVHYWRGEDGGFRYGVVPSEQIIPVESSDMSRNLTAVLRTYKDIDFQSGKEITVWEYWDAERCYTYYRKSNTLSVTGLLPYNAFQPQAEQGNIYAHGWGRVPFIAFRNNNIRTDDLENIKPLTDAYDKVFSGFLNDLEDVQEIIMILTNYGGTDLKEFFHDLKKYKAIKVDSEDEGGGKGGVETLTINIPVEAREKFLEMTRKAIFEQGQGVDPDPQKFGNTSGEALKYLYSLLELKAGLMETEFRLGFGELVRAICGYLYADCKQIVQTWTRSAIRSDAELADIAAKSAGIVSNKTILKNHPFVENAEEEERQIRKEQDEAMEKENAYRDAFRKNKKEAEGGGEDVNAEEE